MGASRRSHTVRLFGAENDMNAGRPMRKLTYREAVREGIREALRRDERVFLMGEDVGRYGGCFAVTKGLLQEFGPERIRDTPLSESAFVGAGLMFAGLTDSCGMAMVLAKMPWNQVKGGGEPCCSR